MVEKSWGCRKCRWTPKNIDEQSRICPKCGEECTLEDVLTKDDVQAYYDELRNSKDFRVRDKSSDEI